MEHVVKLGHLPVGVGEQREIEGRALGLLDVARPPVVGVDRVDAKAHDLDVALVELRLELRDHAKLGCANRGEVGGMRKKDGPAIALPLAEMYWSLGRVLGEV